MSIRDILVTGVTSKLPGDYAVIHEPRQEPAPVVSQYGRKVITFVIPGAPIGKVRMTRSDKWRKRPCVLRYRAWADKARASAGEVPKAETVKSITAIARFAPPQSWSKKKRLAAIGKYHRVKPDADNALKSLGDALWPENDSALADVRCIKIYDWEPSLTVIITLIEDGNEEAKLPEA